MESIQPTMPATETSIGESLGYGRRMERQPILRRRCGRIGVCSSEIQESALFAPTPAGTMMESSAKTLFTGAADRRREVEPPLLHSIV
jgi:hypothetical protein